VFSKNQQQQHNWRHPQVCAVAGMQAWRAEHLGTMGACTPTCTSHTQKLRHAGCTTPKHSSPSVMAAWKAVQAGCTSTGRSTSWLPIRDKRPEEALLQFGLGPGQAAVQQLQAGGPPDADYQVASKTHPVNNICGKAAISPPQHTKAHRTHRQLAIKNTRHKSTHGWRFCAT
jgi:hypothetical protein